MLLSPRLTAIIRLIFVSFLTLGNILALWKVIERPKHIGRRHINRLSLISILFINLFYISFVWTPFSVNAFNHYVRNGNKTIIIEKKKTTPLATEEQSQRMESVPVVHAHSKRDKRWAEAEVEQQKLHEGHEGSWSLAFPIRRGHNKSLPSSEVKTNGRIVIFPPYLSVDCTLQDLVTTASLYSLSFVTVIKLILTKRPIALPTSACATSSYIFLLTGVPILATFAIRYGEQLGANFTPHNPDTIIGGYILYNIICDVHIDDAYVFFSFLEWAGLIMVLLLTVTSFLSLSKKADEVCLYKDKMNVPAPSSLLEKLSSKAGHWVRDLILYVTTLWTWPLKPTFILVYYVMIGRNWTNTISLVSHVIVAISAVFQPLATFLTVDLYVDDPRKASSNRESTNRRTGEVVVLPPKYSLPVVENMQCNNGLITLINEIPDDPPPSYKECTKSTNDSNVPVILNGKFNPLFRSAKDIRDKIKRGCDSYKESKKALFAKFTSSNETK